MTRKVGNFPVSDGIQHKMSGKDITGVSFMDSNFMFVFRTVLLSVISLLNEPNTFSPANVDASVMYRRWKESKGKDKEYENIIRFGF